MISADTGPMHLASAVGTPVVALFGPTRPARNGPWSSSDVSLSKYADCSCHYERRCRRRSACLDEIGSNQVLDAVDRRLAAMPAHA
jgi:ADP-heptose:LPS heptosyltransferase